MNRDELHEIGALRRGDADIRVLLLEIKRLRDVLVQAHDLAGALPPPAGLNGDYTHQRLIELLGEEPAILESPPARYSKPNRQPPPENETDRAAKRKAREERR